MLKFKVLIVSLFALFMLSGCGDDGGTSATKCTLPTECKSGYECKFDDLEVVKGTCVKLTKCTENEDCKDSRECKAKDVDESYCGYTDQAFGIESKNLTNGKKGVLYSDKLNVVGSAAPYYFSLKGASRVPNGLILSENGTISGTPTEVVTDFEFTVVAINGKSDSDAYYNYRSAEATFKITITDEATDVCDPNPCNQAHKTVCTDNNGTAVCSCDEGYKEDENGNCIEDVNNPCNPNPCDEEFKTVCTNDNGTAKCSCDEGYTEDENGKCIENVTNPCEPNPCDEEHKTVCTVENETAVCSCDEGYELEGSNCVPVYVDPCFPENTCTESFKTICRDENHDGTAECSCIEGYIENNGICQIDSTCPANQYFGEDGECHCYPGYAGATCTTCAEGYVATNGRCLFNCSGDTNSQVNETNNACVCKTGFFLNPATNKCDKPCSRTDAPVCGSDQVCNDITGMALCYCDEADGFTDNATGTACECADENATENATGTACVCDSGYVKDITGICVLSGQCTIDELTEEHFNLTTNLNSSRVNAYVLENTITNVVFENLTTQNTACAKVEDWYKIELPANKKITVSIEATGDLDLKLYKNEETTAVSSSATSSYNETVNYTISLTDAPEGTTIPLYIQVYYSQKVYKMTVKVEDFTAPVTTELQGGDTCATAVEITESGIYSGTTDLASLTDSTYGVCGETGAKDTVYTLILTEPTFVNVKVTGFSGVTLFIRKGDCADETQVYCAASSPNFNGELAAGTYHIYVDGGEYYDYEDYEYYPEEGDYSLTVQFLENPCNSTCGENELCSFANNTYSCTCDTANGYFDNGFVCINPCDAVSCGENGTCTATNAITTSCACSEGFVKDLVGTCVVVGECFVDALSQTANNTRATATQLESLENQTITQLTTQDANCTKVEDWYKIDAVAGQKITARIDFIDADGDLDLKLYKNAETTTTSTSVSSTNNYETVSHVVTADATYYIQVSFGRNIYSLNIKLTPSCTTNTDCSNGFVCISNECVTDLCSPTNPCTESHKTVCTQTATNYTCACDTNYFLSNGACVNPCESANAPVCDGENEYCKATSATLASCACETGYARDINGVCVLTGNCLVDELSEASYIAIEALNSTRANSYQLPVVESQTLDNLTTQDANCTKVDDWYKIDVSAGKKITAKIDFIDANGDLDLKLYKGTETTATSSSAGSTDSEIVSHVATVANTYYIQVTFARNIYSLTVLISDACTTNDDCSNGLICLSNACVQDLCNPTNPCTTSHKTVCTQNATGFTCGCDSGYFASGENCVNPCDSVSCPSENGNGTCTATSATAYTCACDSGYYFEIVNGTPVCTQLLGNSCTDTMEIITEAGVYTGNTNANGYTSTFNSHTCQTSAGSKDMIFQLELAERSEVTLEVTSTSFTDSVLSIHQPCGTSIACDDDSSDNGMFSKIVKIIPAGTYFIVVDGYGTTNQGTFSLSVGMTPVSDLCTPNPCTDLNKTVCTQTGQTTTCSCDTGYFLNAESNCVNPCNEANAPDCSAEHQYCKATSATVASCACETGFVMVGNTCVVETPLQGADTCADPVVQISEPGVYIGTITADNTNSTHGNACSTTSTGKEVVYELVVEEDSFVTITETGLMDIVLYMRNECMGTTDLVCSDTPETITKYLTAGTYYLFMDVWSSTTVGNYSLKVEMGNPCEADTAPDCSGLHQYFNPTSATAAVCACDTGYFMLNGVCVNPCEEATAPDCSGANQYCKATSATTASCACEAGYSMVGTECIANYQGADSCTEPAVQITGPGVYNGTITETNTNSTHGNACSTTSTGKEVVYELVVAEDSFVKVTETGSMDIVLYMRNECMGTTDLVCSDTPENISKFLTAGTYYLFMDVYSSTTVGNYSLTVEMANPCNEATAPDCSGIHQYCNPTSATTAVCACDTDYFMLNNVCVNPCEEANAPDCSALHQYCKATSATVASCACETGFTMVGTECMVETPLQGADTCAEPTVQITGPGVYTGTITTSNTNSTHGNACGTSSTGKEVVYELVVAEDSFVKVTETGTMDIVLYMRNECMGTTDLACSDTPENISKFLTVGTYYLFMDVYSSTTVGNYSLTVEMANPCESVTCPDASENGTGICTPASSTDYTCGCQDGFGFAIENGQPVCNSVGANGADVCTDDSAVPIISNSGVWLGTTIGAVNNYGTSYMSCTGESENGNDVVYKVVLAPGQTIDAILTKTAGTATFIVLYILTSCDVSSCVSDGGDSAYSPFELLFTNSTSSEMSYYLVVDAYSSGNAYDFSLEVSIY